MEILQLLQACSKRNLNARKAFAWMGFTKPSMMNKTLKSMDDEENFACLMNWALNKMPHCKAINIRLKVDGQIYQTAIRNTGRQIRITKPFLKENVPGSVLYEWTEEMTYNKLDVGRITESILRADGRNAESARKRSFENERLVQDLFDTAPVGLTAEDSVKLEEFLSV